MDQGLPEGWHNSEAGSPMGCEVCGGPTETDDGDFYWCAQDCH